MRKKTEGNLQTFLTEKYSCIFSINLTFITCDVRLFYLNYLTQIATFGHSTFNNITERVLNLQPGQDNHCK
jgi:nitric oxide reductase activation protein